MRYFLTLLLVSSSLTALAQSPQNEASLFPELNVIKPENTKSNEEIILKKTDELLEEDQSSQDTSDDIEEEDLFVEPEEKPTIENKEKEPKEEDDGIPTAIVWNIDGVQQMFVDWLTDLTKRWRKEESILF